MDAPTAILIGAGFATLGWVYTGRRARTLAKKQHTINIMLQAAFSKEFRDALAMVAPHLKDGKCPDLNDNSNEVIHAAFRLLMNHYEFLAAGMRNGDIDETLVRDSERGTILAIVDTCQSYIYGVRTTRRRQTIYEHLEWLHGRWENRRPRPAQRMVEWLLGRPLSGKKIKT